MAGPPLDAFVSFSNQDRDFVRRLAAALKEGGASVYFDERLTPGDEWAKELDRALAESRTVLSVVSPPAVTSETWRQELASALALQKRIIPLLYRDLGDAEMPAELASRQWVDFRDEKNFQEGVAQLLAALRNGADGETAGAPLPENAQRPGPAGAERLLIQREGDSSFLTLECTPALSRVLMQATLFSRHRGERFALSFTAILLALSGGESALGRWFGRYLAEAGVDRAGLLERGRVKDEAEFESVARARVQPWPPTEPLLATASANNAVRRAQELREQTSAAPGLPLDVRHIMGAFIYNPSFHQADFDALRLDRRAWSEAFLWQIWNQQIQEMEAWTERHREAFGQEPDVPEGPSTHIATDVWARDDALGYEAYAYALYRFIVHPQTRAPLTISVQAPWGGGKTSLMHMLQSQLDPEAGTAGGPAQHGRGRERLKLRQLLKEIESWIDRGAQQVLPRVPGDDARVLYALWKEVALTEGSGLPLPAEGIPMRDALARVRARLDGMADWANSTGERPLEGKDAPTGPDAALLMKWASWLVRFPGGSTEPPPRTVAQAFARAQARCARLLSWVTLDPTAPLFQQPLEPQPPRRVTVWFNAWKYQETNQVWAGLADAIIRQIADRLPPIERERFWLRLHLRRIDADKVRRAVYDRVFLRFWNSFRKWLLGIAGLGVAWLTAVLAFAGPERGAGPLAFGGLGVVVSLLLSGVREFLRANRDVKEEPARVSLNEYLDLPDYGKELGFLHQVEADLRRVFEAVPRESFPVVVFIDDLDRCSPSKVAQVMEAVNLFLAGDFDQCIFVLGMDTEMVAAALQAAHKDMIANLPRDAGIPVGWKFMDKFVQLPFLIPPAEGPDFARYTEALFGGVPASSTGNGSATTPRAPAAAGGAAPGAGTPAGEAAQPASAPAESHDAAPQVRGLTSDVRRRIDREIEKFSDRNAEIRQLISGMRVHFQGNPRELKRFVNLFRLHYFLWAVRRSQNLEVPSLPQLVRWTVFSIRWPDVVRWMHRGGQGEWQPRSRATVPGDGELVARLKLIEDVTATAADPAAWKKLVQERLRLGETEAPTWLVDDDLFHFLQRREQEGESLLLSEGAGKGLW